MTLSNCPDCITPLDAAHMGLDPCQHCRKSQGTCDHETCEYVKAYKKTLMSVDESEAE